LVFAGPREMTVASPISRIRPYRAEREFGLLVGAILSALGAWWTYREKFPALRPWFLGVGALLVILGAHRPQLLVLPFKAWMGLAEQLARIITTIILAIVFFLVVTPIGVWKRLRGWDPLERRQVATAAGASFWRPYSGRQRDPRHFDRMF
jgi:hypothetical protein